MRGLYIGLASPGRRDGLTGFGFGFSFAFAFCLEESKQGRRADRIVGDVARGCKMFSSRWIGWRMNLEAVWMPAVTCHTALMAADRGVP